MLLEQAILELWELLPLPAPIRLGQEILNPAELMDLDQVQELDFLDLEPMEQQI